MGATIFFFFSPARNFSGCQYTYDEDGVGSHQDAVAGRGHPHGVHGEEAEGEGREPVPLAAG